MAEYQLYCFAQSGNAYRAALMLNLIGADWQPLFVDFFKGGETRTPKYRAEVNEMGEVPVLAHGARNLSRRLALLSGRRVRLRHRRAAQEYRGMVRSHARVTRLGASLRSDARSPAGLGQKCSLDEAERNPGLTTARAVVSRISRSLSSGRPLRVGPVGSIRATWLQRNVERLGTGLGNKLGHRRRCRCWRRSGDVRWCCGDGWRRRRDRR